MVVPWNGVELKDILDKVGVQSGAKYVAFETANRPDEMPGLRYPVLDWPYREGLRLDEALHPFDFDGDGDLRQAHPKSKRRTHPVGGALEIWFQIDQIHRSDYLNGPRARNELEYGQCPRVWLLQQCESNGQPSTLVASYRTQDWRWPV